MEIGKEQTEASKLLGETKHHHPFLLPPLPLYAEYDIMQHQISYPDCVSSQFLVYPQHPADGVVLEAEKALTLCKNCSPVTKTSLKYQHTLQHSSKTQPHTSYFEEN